MLYPEILPLSKFQAVTKSDSTKIQFRALYVGVSGDVAIEDLAGNDVTMVGMLAGVWHPIEGAKVLSTGTTATNIVAALY